MSLIHNDAYNVKENLAARVVVTLESKDNIEKKKKKRKQMNEVLLGSLV